MTSIFAQPFVNLWSSNLESLYDIAACGCLHQFRFILTRLSLGGKVDTLELLRHTMNSEIFLLSFSATKQTWQQTLTDRLRRPRSPFYLLGVSSQPRALITGYPVVRRAQELDIVPVAAQREFGPCGEIGQRGQVWRKTGVSGRRQRRLNAGAPKLNIKRPQLIEPLVLTSLGVLVTILR